MFLDIVWSQSLQEDCNRDRVTALCAGVAVLFLQGGDLLWETLAHCLYQSRPLLVNREALRLLSLLGVGRLDCLSPGRIFPSYVNVSQLCWEE